MEVANGDSSSMLGVGMNASLNVLLLSAGVLGFRHGFDYDHIAAITDIAGIEATPRRTMRLGFMYAIGHAVTVAALGGAVIGFKLALPQGLDRWAEKLVGITLMVLAVYVLGTLVRSKGRVRPKSRGSLVMSAVRWGHLRWRRWRTGDAQLAMGPGREVNGPACFGIGVIHGLGAETPSQIALFLLASNLGGVSRGLLGLSVFLVGLVLMNTLMTASAAGLFKAGRGWKGWAPVLTGVAAAYSFGIGMVFLFGYADGLKNISGS